MRQRRDDIEELARYFVNRYCAEFNKATMDIDADAIEILRTYDWPGNVREIRNCMERAVLLADGNTIRARDISVSPPSEFVPEEETLAQPQLSSLAQSEKDQILEALRNNDWIQKNAAEALGISKRVMHYKIEKYGITHPRCIKNR